MSLYRIESYAYSEGPSNGLEACKFADVQTFGATDFGGTYYARPLVPMAFLDLIAYWAARFTVNLGGNYSITYSDTTGRVTIATNDATVFTPLFSGNTLAFLGFSPQTFIAAQTFTGDLAPLGILTPEAQDMDLRADNPLIAQGDFRHGRKIPIVFGNHKTIDAVLYLRNRELPLMTSGYLRGRVRISTLAIGLATAYDPLNLGGYFDAQIVKWGKPTRTNAGLKSRVPIVLSVARTALTAAEHLGQIASLLRYGWQVAHLLTIEGIPVVFGEMAGMAIPSGFSSLALGSDGKGTLIIDDSAEYGPEVNRETGIGAGLPLGFKFADTVDFNQYLKRPSKVAVLTANLAYNGTQIDVDSTAQWGAPAAGLDFTIWCENEHIHVTEITATAFKGLTRAINGGFASTHYAGQAGGLVTDVPRYWRGREARLFAHAVSPGGIVSTLTAEKEEWFRGSIDNGPERSAGYWTFEAQSLDRRLSAPLAPALSGTVFSQAMFIVKSQFSFSVFLAGHDVAGAYVAMQAAPIVVQPFLGHDGELWSEPEIIAKFASSFATALALDATAPTYISGLTVDLSDPRQMALVLKAAAAIFKVSIQFTIYGGQQQLPDVPFPGGVAAGDKFNFCSWVEGTTPVATKEDFSSSVTISLDKAPDVAIPSKGMVSIGDVGKGGIFYEFSESSINGNLLQLSGITDSMVKAALFGPEIIGLKAEIQAASYGGTPAQAMQTAIQSSGYGTRGPFDTVADGYGIDSTILNSASFAQLTTTPSLLAHTRGKSFADLFGPFLALNQMGVLVKKIDGIQQIACVDINPGGSDFAITITDEHLLTGSGWPITPQGRREIPNQIIVHQMMGETETATYNVIDGSIAFAQGGKTLEFSIPSEDTKNLAQMALWTGRDLLLQTQCLQIVEVRLVPWVGDIQPGDLVGVVVTDPTLWQWSTGTAGYSGVGRCTGIHRDPNTAALICVLILDGYRTTGNLSPAAPVAAWQGAANAPTRIDITDPVAITDLLHSWAAFFSKALLSSNPFKILHYRPGEGAEAAGAGYSITAVALVAGVCRLTVGAVIGAPVLVANSSYVTLPLTADCNTYTAARSHALDGTSWA